MKPSLLSARRATLALVLCCSSLGLPALAAPPRPPAKRAGTAAPLPPLRVADPAPTPATIAATSNAVLADATIAVFEYRTAVAQVADLSDRLSEALQHNTSLKVVDPREGRRRYGVKLDADVAACAGDTACIAAIGAKVGATEVLLFAVSQLGDVVLALQRLDVPNQRVVARLADSLPTKASEPSPSGVVAPAQGPLVQVDEARVLGWLQQLYPPEIFKRYGRIAVSSDISGAQVYVNAKPRGQTPLGEPLSVLAPGNYRILVEKPRFLPFQAQLTVMPDTTLAVTARLVPDAPPTPWYKRWYVWAAVGAGAAIAASSVAVYYGAFYQGPPDMTHIPVGIVIK